MEHITIQEINKVDKDNGDVRLILAENDMRKVVEVSISEGVFVFSRYDLAYAKRVKVIEHIHGIWDSVR